MLRLTILIFLALFADAALAEPVTAFMATAAAPGTFGAALASGAASALVGGLFGSQKKGQAADPAAPKIESPTAMPSPDDQSVQDAKRRSVIAQIQRQGRASTILTDSDKMGA